MGNLVEIWPPFGLRIAAGPLELRVIRDDDIPALVDLARGGIHHPDQMPFYVPWSTVPAADLGGQMAAYYWRGRSAFGPDHWTLDLVARWNGVPVGCQGFSTENYRVTRTGETGSWLGQAHQGHGIGTLMRQSICAFLFDHLAATEITSGAFTDNPASARVSAKVGYRPNGQERSTRRPGEVAVVDRYRLEPDDLVRPDVAVEVGGVAALRRLIGLDGGECGPEDAPLAAT